MQQALARLLSRAQQDMLMQHIDGSCWVPLLIRQDKSAPTRRSLIDLGLIENRLYGEQHTPKRTYITLKGREVLCQVLSDYADALIRAGFHLKLPAEVTEPQAATPPPDLEKMLRSAMLSNAQRHAASV